MENHKEVHKIKVENELSSQVRKCQQNKFIQFSINKKSLVSLLVILGEYSDKLSYLTCTVQISYSIQEIGSQTMHCLLLLSYFILYPLESNSVLLTGKAKHDHIAIKLYRAVLLVVERKAERYL